jgi:hypothetical protein
MGVYEHFKYTPVAVTPNYAYEFMKETATFVSEQDDRVLKAFVFFFC